MIKNSEWAKTRTIPERLEVRTERGWRGEGPVGQDHASSALTLLQLLVFLHFSLQLLLDQLSHGEDESLGRGSLALKRWKAPGLRFLALWRDSTFCWQFSEKPQPFLIQSSHSLGTGERKQTRILQAKP